VVSAGVVVPPDWPISVGRVDWGMLNAEGVKEREGGDIPVVLAGEGDAGLEVEVEWTCIVGR